MLFAWFAYTWDRLHGGTTAYAFPPQPLLPPVKTDVQEYVFVVSKVMSRSSGESTWLFVSQLSTPLAEE